MSRPNPILEAATDESSITGSHVRHKDEIVAILSRLLGAGSLINIEIEGCDRHYNSAFLAINSSTNTIEIDELTPEKGNQSLQKGSSITIISKLNGVTVWFKTKITNVDDSSDVLRYTAILPPTIIYHERRNNFRVHIGVGMVMHIRGQHPVTGENLFGSLMDISPTGCAFKLSGSPRELDRGIILRPVTLIFPDETSIHLDLTVQNRIVTRQTRSIRYGGEFKFRDAEQRKRTNRLVMELQRTIRGVDITY